jgi:pilus assembly protein CpaB
MNVTRVAVLGVACIAAGGAAFLVRGMLGGQTQQVQASTPPPVQMAEILVAAKAVEAGRSLTLGTVQWQSWPRAAIAADFITKDKAPDLKAFVAGTVARAPLVSGEPITETKIAHAGQASFMAATLTSGMRAMSIPISVDSAAGGFLLPNDRVDVILTRKVEQGVVSKTILNDVRVLAIDQTFREEKDKQVVVGKTATLELTPAQTELVAQAQASGNLSLSLRGLGEQDVVANAGNDARKGGAVNVIRYGVTSAGTAAAGGAQ